MLCELHEQTVAEKSRDRCQTVAVMTLPLDASQQTK